VERPASGGGAPTPPAQEKGGGVIAWRGGGTPWCPDPEGSPSPLPVIFLCRPPPPPSRKKRGGRGYLFSRFI